jgi:hypothetical protein
MAEKKWYSMEDVEFARSSLDDLPDLTKKRLTKSDVLVQLRDKIIELADHKGYSVNDIRSGLENAGIEASVKSIREILNSRKKRRASKLPAPKHPTSKAEKFLLQATD